MLLETLAQEQPPLPDRGGLHSHYQILLRLPRPCKPPLCLQKMAKGGMQGLGRTERLHGLQLGRHLLASLPEHAGQLTAISGVLGCEQRVGLSCGASSTCSADAMDVVFHAIGEVIVDHAAHIGDLQECTPMSRGFDT